MPADVFVSYARKDRERVLPWVQELQRAGISVWMDETGIDGASLWPQVIVEAIHACRVLILLVSPASVASEQVLREVTLAMQAKKPLLPLLLEPVEIPAALQYPLAGVQHIELFGGDREEKLQALLRCLARLGVTAFSPETTSSAQTPVLAPSRPERHDGKRASHNLPRQLTRFIGREREIAEVEQILATAALLTLTGAGGTGKTRLGLQVATRLVASYPDGVWLVELASLADPALVPQEVARAVGVREEPGRPLIETLIDFLQLRHLLLVLDNCEHLVAAVAALAEALLRACPGVRLLATSREPLAVPGEAIWRVPSLSLPDLHSPVSVEHLTRHEAVQLFLDRARLHQPAFAVTDANAGAVAQVCHRLEGIPLAIELAAARVKMLSVEQMVDRLQDQFGLLTEGGRTALPRHQTLRATMDWSYSLLSRPERLLLQRLSVFAGGWTLEAADEVCAGQGVEKTAVIDLLGQLVDKSLVSMEEQEGKARFHLLEIIRQYGQEQLRRSGEEIVWRTRHQRWCLRLVAQAELGLMGADQALWLDRLEQEHDNLRAVLEWARDRAGAEYGLRAAATTQLRMLLPHRFSRAFREAMGVGGAWVGLRLGASLCPFWVMRGHLTEGWETLTDLLARTGASVVPKGKTAQKSQEQSCNLAFAAAAAPTQSRMPALGWRLQILLCLVERLPVEKLGWLPLALPQLAILLLRLVWSIGPSYALLGLMYLSWKQSISSPSWLLVYPLYLALLIWQRARAREFALFRQARAPALWGASTLAQHRADYAAARFFYAKWGTTQDLLTGWELGDVLNTLGRMALREGDYHGARLLLRRSLVVWRKEPARTEVVRSLYSIMSSVARARESQKVPREVRDKRGMAGCFDNLGAVALHEGDLTEAEELFRRSLALWREIGDQLEISSPVQGLGDVAYRQGDIPAARARYEESLTVCRRVGNKEGIASCLEALAEVAGAVDQPGRAARLLGAAKALRDAISAPLPPNEHADYERTLGAVHAALGEEAFAAAWAAGQAVPLEQEMAEALAEQVTSR